MGVYDTYGNVQLKVGDVSMSKYKIGDRDVQLEDGVYIGNEGVVVIKNDQFIAEFPCLISKWGETITPKEILDTKNPVNQAIDQVIRIYKKTSQRKKVFIYLIERTCGEISDIQEQERNTEGLIMILKGERANNIKKITEAYVFLNQLQEDKLELYRVVSGLLEELTDE